MKDTGLRVLIFQPYEQKLEWKTRISVDDDSIILFALDPDIGL